MHPAVRANIETDVDLTVAQISIFSMLLTYAGFGIHNVQTIHQRTMSSPTSCFYGNYFYWTSDCLDLEKKTFSDFVCSSMYTVFTTYLNKSKIQGVNTTGRYACRQYGSTDARVKKSRFLY